MITYALACENEHRFDAWFRSAEAFDEQLARGIVSCPVCASIRVGKALMAPAVARSGSDMVTVSSGHPQQAEIRELLRAMRRKVVSEADYVGDRFAEEARKIHFQEAEARGIYGETSAEEAEALSEEGVPFAQIPWLPKESA